MSKPPSLVMRLPPFRHAQTAKGPTPADGAPVHRPWLAHVLRPSSHPRPLFPRSSPHQAARTRPVRRSPACNRAPSHPTTQGRPCPHTHTPPLTPIRPHLPPCRQTPQPFRRLHTRPRLHRLKPPPEPYVPCQQQHHWQVQDVPSRTLPPYRPARRLSPPSAWMPPSRRPFSRLRPGPCAAWKPCTRPAPQCARLWGCHHGQCRRCLWFCPA